MKQLNKITRTMNKVNSKVRDAEVLVSGNPGRIASRAKNKSLFRILIRLFR